MTPNSSHHVCLPPSTQLDSRALGCPNHFQVLARAWGFTPLLSKNSDPSPKYSVRFLHCDHQARSVCTNTVQICTKTYNDRSAPSRWSPWVWTAYLRFTHGHFRGTPQVENTKTNPGWFTGTTGILKGNGWSSTHQQDCMDFRDLWSSKSAKSAKSFIPFSTIVKDRARSKNTLKVARVL